MTALESQYQAFARILLTNSHNISAQLRAVQKFLTTIVGSISTILDARTYAFGLLRMLVGINVGWIMTSKQVLKHKLLISTKVFLKVKLFLICIFYRFSGIIAVGKSFKKNFWSFGGGRKAKQSKATIIGESPLDQSQGMGKVFMLQCERGL